MGTKTGVRLRPSVERERLYRLALHLGDEGLSYKQIMKRIEAEQGVRLRKSHLSGWITGRHRPFGYVRAFDASQCAELAYVIGVMMGDASMSVTRNYDYKIKLRVTDKEFAEEFSRCLSVILSRTPPRVRWHEKTRLAHAWHTGLSSLLLQNFLRQDLKQLTPTIQHCHSCESAFLRGFFDSEGCISGLRLTVSNGDLDKLEFVCKLLDSPGDNYNRSTSHKRKGWSGFYRR
jgi:intein-encoded DNA endonuclease-like protein